METNDTYLSRELGAMVDQELEPGERVVWSGQPLPSRYARKSIGLVLFGIPWTAFALFWTVSASGFKVPDFSRGAGIFPLFGLPFVLIGCGLLASPWWMRRAARRTIYVLTDRRAVILASGFWRSLAVRSFGPEKLNDLRRVQYPDGSGDLIFERTLDYRGPNNGQPTDYGFMGIRDVKEVESMVRKLAEPAAVPR